MPPWASPGVGGLMKMPPWASFGDAPRPSAPSALTSNEKKNDTIQHPLSPTRELSSRLFTSECPQRFTRGAF